MKVSAHVLVAAAPLPGDDGYCGSRPGHRIAPAVVEYSALRCLVVLTFRGSIFYVVVDSVVKVIADAPQEDAPDPVDAGVAHNLACSGQ